jgi:uncharacterized protein (DUF4415 family)
MNEPSRLIRNTPDEESAVQRGITADADTFEVPAESFSEMKRSGARGRPKLERPKVLLTVRYDADIIDAFKATGEGWQTRMNDALREWLRARDAAGNTA